METIALVPTTKATGVVVRPYLPCGMYPAGTFLHPDAVFHASDQVAFAILRVRYPNPEHAERPWTFTDEIRLLASVALSVDVGLLSAYPSRTLFTLSGSDEIANSNVIKKVEELLQPQLAHLGASTWDGTMDEFRKRASYELRDCGTAFERIGSVYQAIDPTDALMMRGLGALLKAPLLANHYCFHTEACISLHVAMEASGEMIRRCLRASGKRDSYVDAGDFLAETFGVNVRGMRYFEEFYDDRIKAIHPTSRVGTFADPELAADDYYDLYEHLTAVYDFLITGAVRQA